MCGYSRGVARKKLKSGNMLKHQSISFVVSETTSNTTRHFMSGTVPLDHSLVTSLLLVYRLKIVLISWMATISVVLLIQWWFNWASLILSILWFLFGCIPSAFSLLIKLLLLSLSPFLWSLFSPTLGMRFLSASFGGDARMYLRSVPGVLSLVSP